MPGLESTDPAEHRRQAEAWCDRFEANTRKWLKSTIATCRDGEPELSYEDIDTSLDRAAAAAVRPGGAEVIEEVWKQRQAAKTATSSGNGNGRARRRRQIGRRPLTACATRKVAVAA